MANKKTKKEFFREMKEIFEEMGRTEYVEFCNHQIELLDNKASGQKGMSKTQKENAKAKAEAKGKKIARDKKARAKKAETEG